VGGGSNGLDWKSFLALVDMGSDTSGTEAQI
jgi:hypothetical protein